jgi:hypothetical protein
MKLFANGGWRDAARGRLFIGGAWRTITRAMVYTGGAWKTAVKFASTLTVSIPAEYDVFVSGSPAGYGGTGVVATPSGGVAPYSYYWTVTSYSGFITPNLGTPTLAGTSVDAGAYEFSINTVNLAVLVTDAIGQTATGTTSVIFDNS